MQSLFGGCSRSVRFFLFRKQALLKHCAAFTLSIMKQEEYLPVATFINYMTSMIITYFFKGQPCIHFSPVWNNAACSKTVSLAVLDVLKYKFDWDGDNIWWWHVTKASNPGYPGYLKELNPCHSSSLEDVWVLSAQVTKGTFWTTCGHPETHTWAEYNHSVTLLVTDLVTGGVACVEQILERAVRL